MSLDPLALLGGPRGRRLCLEVVLAHGERPEVQDAASAVMWASHRLARNPGTILTVGGGPSDSVAPEVSPAQAAGALRRVRPRVDADVVDAGLAAAVDFAAYWQPPYGEDVLAATDDVVAVLRPWAESIVRETSTQWWSTPVARTAQALVFWESERLSEESPRARLSQWRAAMAEEEERFATEYADRDVSGSWWSSPPHELPRSTRRRDGGAPAGLTLVEDSFGWETARVQCVRVPEGEVVEIDGPDAWARLCRRHPLDVTASRRFVWQMTTGREGAWVQPDWAAIAREAAGVHLTVAGYLATAGKVIDLGELGASALAGWGPDETFWFDSVEPSGPEEHWTLDRSAIHRPWRRV